ncbi:MAG: hypothetical protein KA190_07225 [Kofleriaceae bacterium]|jgi:hypothetical protein|nr:hypothetical protein [Kofleriaceae bacterium]
MRKRTPLRPRALDVEALDAMTGAGSNFIRFGDMRCRNCGLRQPLAPACVNCAWVPGQPFQ